MPTVSRWVVSFLPETLLRTPRAVSPPSAKASIALGVFAFVLDRLTVPERLNFVEMGGDSLQAAVLNATVSSLFGVTLTPAFALSTACSPEAVEPLVPPNAKTLRLRS